MARALQLSCWLATKSKAALQVSHIAGIRNDLADAISRHREPGSQERLASLCPEKEVRIHWQALVGEVWPEEAFPQRK
jgi:hypothetical protein